jgi:hypothetical protein
MESANPRVAKARDSESVARAERRRNKDELAWLQSVADRMPVETESAGEFVRAMRDGERY